MTQHEIDLAVVESMKRIEIAETLLHSIPIKNDFVREQIFDHIRTAKRLLKQALGLLK